MSAPRPTSIAELLAGCDPEVRRVAEATRKYIMRAVPQAIEKLRGGWGLIGYNAPAYFAFIDVSRGHVRIGFEWGVLLPDPEHLLQGSGTQVRYVQIESARDLRPALTDLLREAAMLEPRQRPRRAR